MFIEKDGDGYRFVSTDGRRMRILAVAEEYVREGLAWIDCLMEGCGCYNMEIERVTTKEIMLGGELEAAYPNYRKYVPEKKGRPLAADFGRRDFDTSVYTLNRAGFLFPHEYLKDLGIPYETAWNVYGTSGKAAVVFEQNAARAALKAVIMPRNPDEYDASVFNWTAANNPAETRLREAPATDSEPASEAEDEPEPAIEAEAEPSIEAAAKEEAEPVIEAEREAPIEAEAKQGEKSKPVMKGEFAKRKKTFTKEEKAAYYKEKRERAEAQYNSVLESVGNNREKLYALFDLLNARSPCSLYSDKNKAIVIANGTLDARSFLQWKQAGRKVKKGARAFFIFKPCLFKDSGSADENGNPVKDAVLFGFTPVFRYEDTESADDSVYIYEPVKQDIAA
jgi:hypothetical protein